MSAQPEGMHQRRRWLAAIGVFGCVLAIAYTAHGVTAFSFGKMAQPGAAVFPAAVGVILLVTSILLILNARTVPATEIVDVPVGGNRNRVGALVGLFIAYAVFLPIVGFMASTFVFLLFASRAIGGASWLRCAVLAALVSVGAYWAFAVELHVPLPRDRFLDLL